MMSAFREACAYVFSSRNLSWSSCHTIAWYFFSTLFQTKEYYEGTPSAAKSSIRIYDILRKSLKLNICLEMKRKWPLWNFWEKKKGFGWGWLGRPEDTLFCYSCLNIRYELRHWEVFFALWPWFNSAVSNFY